MSASIITFELSSTLSYPTIIELYSVCGSVANGWLEVDDTISSAFSFTCSN